MHSVGFSCGGSQVAEPNRDGADVSPQATLSKHAVPADIASRRTLTLADYKRRQGIS